DISLDPETHSFHLIVPEDFKYLKYEPDSQDQPDKQEDYFVTVLGAQTFTSGTHYWEVDVEGQTEWVLGICEDSVSKNGNVSILFEDVRAIIGLKDENEMLFWRSSDFFYKMPTNKVGILLNYEEGNVSFYDMKNRCVLFSFPNSAFQGPVRPFFSTSLLNKGNTS
ncbi:probable E3 ubiquitin-protein ligase TRIML1, partial [Gracilinanus agilis]|uniref:probable E3 ubiquitin-protein ligase TRIML1 n=1 Tax=Gracilinanus agilis TaxID=191870 RepID=UPI001CFDD929